MTLLALLAAFALPVPLEAPPLPFRLACVRRGFPCPLEVPRIPGPPRWECFRCR